MAMGPINYAVDVGNPIQSFMSGVGQMQGLQMNDQAMAMREQQMQAMKQQQEQQAAAAERAKAFQTQFGTLLGNPNLNGENIGQFMAQFPEYSKEITASFGALSDERKAKGVRFAGEVYTLLDGGNVEMARERLQERLTAAQNSGDNATVASMKTAMMMLDNDPTGGTAKNFARFMGNAMVGGDFESMIGAGGGRVQSSRILDDGTVVAVNTDGSVVVRDNTGEVVTGQAAAEAVAKANEYGAGVQGNRAESRRIGENTGETKTGAAAAAAGEAGKIAQQLSTKAFEDVAKIRATIRNLNDAIKAVEDGANSGAVIKRFPNWNTATIELENAANRLGLDVIGSVTFGALSESEMEKAMATAMPNNLGPEALKNWLQEKRAAQEKMASELQFMARYLSKPGNTINSWLEEYGSGGEKISTGNASPQAPGGAPASKPRSYFPFVATPKGQ